MSCELREVLRYLEMSGKMQRTFIGLASLHFWKL